MLPMCEVGRPACSENESKQQVEAYCDAGDAKCVGELRSHLLDLVCSRRHLPLMNAEKGG